MKTLIATSIILLVIFSGCNGLNDDERYITKLKEKDTLDIGLDDLVVKEANDSTTKYYYSYWHNWAGNGRKYFITVDKKNIVKSVWSKRY